jgi:RNA polymerase sigma-70 factor (ECF subfamily)
MMRGRPALHVVVPLVAEEQLETSALDPATAFRRYASYVAAVAHRLLGRDQEVDDTVQEVFLAAIRGLSSVREPAAVKGWLARITVRVVHRRLRVRRARMLFGLDQVPARALAIDESVSGEQRALLASVYRVLDEIPSDQRIAWVLRHIEGERLEDVATLAGCSLATAKRRIAAAEQRIGEALDES